jgi:all-beta uncharacterized protein/BACON domain-containing protein
MSKDRTLTPVLFVILAISMGSSGVFAQSGMEMSVPCTYTSSITSQFFGWNGGSGSAAVNSPPNCSWAVGSPDGWIMASGGGNGDGSIAYFVAPNDTAFPRSGSIMVAGQSFTITEDGAPCSYSMSSPSQSFEATGGSGSVAVSATPGCEWTGKSNDSWISVNSGGGNGNGTFSYAVAPNDTTSQRSGSITIAEQSVTITQDGIHCSYSINPRDQSFGVAGGSGSVTVSAIPVCEWTGTSNDSWITLNSGGGNGEGTLSYVVASNDDATQRWGSITIAGQSVTVTQEGMGILSMAGQGFTATPDGAHCIYSISPLSASFIADGGSDSISVTAPAGCSWTATGDPRWIRVTAGGSGSGNGTFTYSVSSNSGKAVRLGSLSIDGLSFIVVQAGRP